MIHNKYFYVLKQFLGNYGRELYGRELIGKIAMSQKGIALALEELENTATLKSRKQGSIKYYRLNAENTEIKDFLVVAELLRKAEFLASHRKLAYLFREDDRIVGVFGSYARGVEKEGSDLDIFVIGGKGPDYEEKGKELDIDGSVKLFSKTQWKELLLSKNTLAKEIVYNHVLIFGAERFVSEAWRVYYGFN